MLLEKRCFQEEKGERLKRLMIWTFVIWKWLKLDLIWQFESFHYRKKTGFFLRHFRYPNDLFGDSQLRGVYNNILLFQTYRRIITSLWRPQTILWRLEKKQKFWKKIFLFEKFFRSRRNFWMLKKRLKIWMLPKNRRYGGGTLKFVLEGQNKLYLAHKIIWVKKVKKAEGSPLQPPIAFPSNLIQFASAEPTKASVKLLGVAGSSLWSGK